MSWTEQNADLKARARYHAEEASTRAMAFTSSSLLWSFDAAYIEAHAAAAQALVAVLSLGDA